MTIKKEFILPLSLLIVLSTVSLTSAGTGKDSIAYKLAILYARNETPENILIRKPTVPTTAVVTEFQWILDSLKSRCLNPETALADTIVESWTALKKAGKPISLLETARELSSITKNTNLFGNQKVNFRMTSRHWLNQKLGKKIENNFK